MRLLQRKRQRLNLFKLQLRLSRSWPRKLLLISRSSRKRLVVNKKQKLSKRVKVLRKKSKKLKLNSRLKLMKLRPRRKLRNSLS